MPAVAKYCDPSMEFYARFAKAIEELGLVDTFDKDNNLRLNISREAVVDTDYIRMANSIEVRMYNRGTDKGIARWFVFEQYEMMNPNIQCDYMRSILKDMFKQITEG